MVSAFFKDRRKIPLFRRKLSVLEQESVIFRLF